MSEAYTVKALEWERSEYEGAIKFTANTSIGTLTVQQTWWNDDEPRSWQWSYEVAEYYDEGAAECADSADGKAKAEAWYLSRLMPALVPLAPAAKPAAPDAANVGELREAEKMLARISKQIIDSNSEDLSDWLETWTAQVFASPAPRPDAAAPSAADAGVVGRLVELEAIVAKLPKTADGVPVTPGMTLYLMPDRRGATAEDMMKLDVPIHGNYCWFSSCDTALAAAPDGKKGKDQ